jgi:hypothetical protein
MLNSVPNQVYKDFETTEAFICALYKIQLAGRLNVSGSAECDYSHIK